jgi:hypothetical protein
MTPTQKALLEQLAASLRRSATLVEELLASCEPEPSRHTPEATLSIEEIEAAILKHGSPRKAAEALGVCLPTLNRRLKAVYGPFELGDAAASGALLRRLIVRLGRETVAEEIGTDAANVDRWARQHRIPGTARRAIARVAEKHGISLSEPTANACSVKRPR